MATLASAEGLRIIGLGNLKRMLLLFHALIERRRLLKTNTSSTSREGFVSKLRATDLGTCTTANNDGAKGQITLRVHCPHLFDTQIVSLANTCTV